MIATALMVASAAIPFAIGALHFVYTFAGPKLTPRDPALQASMREVSPVITRETTMWRCWIGFNATHSMGLMLFGLIYGFLAVAHGDLLFDSMYLLALGLLTLGGFVALAKAYFFSIPFTCLSIASVCYVVSIAVALA